MQGSLTAACGYVSASAELKRQVDFVSPSRATLSPSEPLMALHRHLHHHKRHHYKSLTNITTSIALSRITTATAHYLKTCTEAKGLHTYASAYIPAHIYLSICCHIYNSIYQCTSVYVSYGALSFVKLSFVLH